MQHLLLGASNSGLITCCMKACIGAAICFQENPLISGLWLWLPNYVSNLRHRSMSARAECDGLQVLAEKQALATESRKRAYALVDTVEPYMKQMEEDCHNARTRHGRWSDSSLLAQQRDFLCALRDVEFMLSMLYSKSFVESTAKNSLLWLLITSIVSKSICPQHHVSIWICRTARLLEWIVSVVDQRLFLLWTSLPVSRLEGSNRILDVQFETLAGV